MPSPPHLFVYGTLRRSDAHPMHALLLPATFLGPATFQGKLYNVGAYPAAVPSDDPAARVHGELYLLHDPSATLARLDRYEACAPSDPAPHEYVRATLPVTLPDGETLPAQIYLYHWPVATLTPVASGDYLRWRATRPSARSAGG